MGVDLGGIQAFMAQNFLERTHIHAILKHQGGRCVAQFMRRIALWIQTGGGASALDQNLDTVYTDPPMVA